MLECCLTLRERNRPPFMNEFLGCHLLTHPPAEKPGQLRPRRRWLPTRDRWFESASLQQRVRLSGVPRTLSAKVNLYVGIERIGSSGNFALHRSELPLVFIISSLR